MCEDKNEAESAFGQSCALLLDRAADRIGTELTIAAIDGNEDGSDTDLYDLIPALLIEISHELQQETGAPPAVVATVVKEAVNRVLRISVLSATQLRVMEDQDGADEDEE